MSAQQTNIRIQAVSVFIGALLLLSKFFAYFLTHSNTILTDALESIVNVVAGGLGLYSLIVAAMPKDENHPYGHGKVEFISAGVEGTLISIAGLIIIAKSIQSLFYPQAIEQLDWGILIAAVAGLVNYGLGAWTENQGKKTNSLALIASGKHLKSDAYSTVGLVVGLGIIFFFNYAWLDSAIAILFGFLIAYTGYGIIRESISGIMDEADYDLIEKIVLILDQHRLISWIDIHNLRVIKYGHALHIDCHLTVARYLDVVQAHAISDELETLLKSKINAPVELFVHIDACVPTSCALCQNPNCPIRTSNFQTLEPWTIQNVMRNQKHKAVTPL